MLNLQWKPTGLVVPVDFCQISRCFRRTFSCLSLGFRWNSIKNLRKTTGTSSKISQFSRFALEIHSQNIYCVESEAIERWNERIGDLLNLTMLKMWIRQITITVLIVQLPFRSFCLSFWFTKILVSRGEK